MLKKTSGLLNCLLMLTGFLILIEISFLIQSSASYLGGFTLVAHHLTIPMKVVPGLCLFVGAQLAIHFTFSLLIFVLVSSISRTLHWSSSTTLKWGIVIWFLALLTVLLANRYYFPNSRFAELFPNALNVVLMKWMLVFLATLFFMVTAFAFYGLSRPLCISLAFVFVASWVYNAHTSTMATLDGATSEKPNIIIIGIDSLRPDFLGYFGYTNISPHLDRFLNHAAVFSDALTTLARTYPSWVSILTGEYPKINTMRTNLEDQKTLDYRDTLPSILKKNGYETLYATDETRFSNIDQRFGFDKTVSPPIGLNDFLLGMLNDFPLSNFLVNTALGKIIFPYSYANRAAAVTYNPDTFLQNIKPILSQPRNKPLFLAIHFCLPHFPYSWASLRVQKATMHDYQYAITRADKQFYDFMRILKEKKLLEHTIVVVLSDHGEGVEIAGDRVTDPELYISNQKSTRKIPHFYPATADHEKVNQSGGHGTDVLGLPQYHTVLAFRSFGMTLTVPRTIPGMVSLLDIKPTLLAYLHIPANHLSGVSLLDIINGKKTAQGLHQDIFVESDFSPEAVRSVHPEMSKVLFEGISYFRIDPLTARVMVKDSMLKLILASKQYADYSGDWVLALYPKENKRTPILVNLRTGEWTDDLTIPFAKKSPAKQMLAKLHQFYGEDMTLIGTSSS